MNYSAGKVVFHRSFFELSNSFSNFQHCFVTHNTTIKLHDIVHPFISIQRKTDKFCLKIATSFSGPSQLPSIKAKHVSAALEYLYTVLFVASSSYVGLGIIQPIDTTEMAPIETCGLVKLIFKDVRLSFVSDSAADKLKEGNIYLAVKCSPYTEYVKIANSDDDSQPEKAVFM